MRWGQLVCGSQGPPYKTFLNGCDIVFSPALETSSWVLWLFKYDGEWLRNYLFQSCQDPGMPHAWWTFVCSGSSGGLKPDLLFWWKDLIPPFPPLRFRKLRDVGRGIASKDWDKKKLLSTTVFSMCYTTSPICSIRGAALHLDFIFWLIYLLKPLLFFIFFHKYSSNCALSFPDPTRTNRGWYLSVIWK